LGDEEVLENVTTCVEAGDGEALCAAISFWISALEIKRN